MSFTRKLKQLSNEQLELRAAALVRELFGREAERRFRAASQTRTRCIEFIIKNTPQLPSGR